MSTETTTPAGRCLTCEAWGRAHCGEHSGRPLPTILDRERQSLCICPRDKGVETRSHAKACTRHWSKVERIIQARLLDLAERATAAEAAIKAEALREAATAAVTEGDDCVPWDHDHDRATVACWLQARAAALDPAPATEVRDDEGGA